MIIDSHAHLDYPQLGDDLDAVLARAAHAGVDQVITIGVKLTTAGQAEKIAETHANSSVVQLGFTRMRLENEPDLGQCGYILTAADHPRCVGHR